MSCQYCHKDCQKAGKQKNGKQKYYCTNCKKYQQADYRYKSCEQGKKSLFLKCLKVGNSLSGVRAITGIAIAARIARPLRAIGNLGALGYIEAYNQMDGGNFVQSGLETGFTSVGLFGNPYGVAASFGWEIGRGITMIPAYQRWKKKAFLPWRKNNLGY